ncbi:hypothetical protein [Marinibactrum halimedae]|uniref:Uncharacterized protein n=1 Tax=Marinibactrum halimedae TaxID=1444977 RepID=A0AA37WMH3_9GAMM|nr:hypothetical protein [Marinibactrum halimedae]MCD9460728.1 hypothetical protein [Marinibactrum halimedae]GLS25146.1 hypothetical protein GCM10007877_08600 [Marinibactrum halimedae]
MKTFMFIVGLFLSPLTWPADKPFTKDLLSSLQSTMMQLEDLEQQFPALQNEKVDEDLFDTKAQLTLIESAGATDAVTKVVKSAGFEGIEPFLRYTQRMMSSIYVVMTEQMPASMNMDAMIQQQESMLASMKSSGMPDTTLQEMQNSIQEMRFEALKIEKAAKQAKPEDITFMRENMGWVMQKFESTFDN